MWGVFLGVVGSFFAVCWGLWRALDDDLMFALAAIAAPLVLGALGGLLGALPKLFSFTVRFAQGDASAYYGGFVPAVAAFGLSFIVAAIGAPLSWWIGPFLFGVALVALLLHPDTRNEFLRRDGVATEQRASTVFWLDQDAPAS